MRQGSSMLQQFGHVEPLGAIAQPFITAQGQAAAALGALGAGHHTTASGPTVGAAMVAEEIAKLHTAVAAMQQMLVGRQVMSDGSDGSHQGQTQQQQRDPGSNADGSLQQPATARRKQQGRFKPFPDMSSQKTLADLAHWYAVQPHPSVVANGRTPKEMEEQKDYAWRTGGAKQRWSEYVVILNCIQDKQQELMDAQRALGRRGVHCDFVTAARALDQERDALPNPNPKSSKPMSVCQYRMYLTDLHHAALRESMAGESAEGEAAATAAAAAAEVEVAEDDVTAAAAGGDVQ